MSAAGSIAGLSPLARKGGLYVLAGAAAALLLAVLPFVSLGGLRDQVAADKAQYELIAARAARLSEGAGVRLTDADEPLRLFLPGETAGTTLAAFQTIVSGAAARNDLTVMRMTPLPGEAAGGAPAYRLSVDATGSIEQLRGFLTDVESGLPLVTVTGFELKPQAAAEPGGDPYPSETLALTLRLQAYGWGGAQ